jgi:hypothetical protein
MTNQVPAAVAQVNTVDSIRDARFVMDAMVSGSQCGFKMPGRDAYSVTTIGDFDGDSQPDLVVPGTSDGRQVLAVCHSNGTDRDPTRKDFLHRIGLLRGSCNDTVYKVEAGSRVRNLYGREVKLKTDAFATSCLTTTEKRIIVYDRDQDLFDSFNY